MIRSGASFGKTRLRGGGGPGLGRSSLVLEQPEAGCGGLAAAVRMGGSGRSGR
jgi:hypothetical protein